MLSFNDILKLNKIDPKDVALLRHIDLYPHEILSLGKERPDLKEFEKYQSFQSSKDRKKFESKYWASFVKRSGTQALFVGLYLNKKRDDNAVRKGCPVLDKNEHEIGSPGCDHYTLEKSKLLAEYQGRLTVNWGKTAINWAVSADSSDKQIVSLDPKAKDDKPFVGFDKFRTLISKLEDESPSTLRELASHTGIYCLSCTKTGKLYIGKADNKEGFLGRWKQYAANRHGENKGLKAHIKELKDVKVDYYVSVLELCGTTTSLNVEKINQRESIWKDRLQTRNKKLQFGLNYN